MRKKILYIILVIQIIAYGIIYIINSQNIDILIVGGNTYVKYYKNNIKIENSLKINPRLNFQKYKIYNGEKFIDGYAKFYKDGISNDTNGILYNSMFDELNLSIPLLAYSGNINIDVANTVITDKITDADKQILKNKLNGIMNNIEDVNFKKITVDINNDTQNEYIYLVYKYDNGTNDKFNSIFMLDSNSNIIDIIDDNVSKNNDYEFNMYNIDYIIDVDMDGEYEVVLSSFSGYSPTNYEIYKLKNSKFEKLG